MRVAKAPELKRPERPGPFVVWSSVPAPLCDRRAWQLPPAAYLNDATFTCKEIFGLSRWLQRGEDKHLKDIFQDCAKGSDRRILKAVVFIPAMRDQ